MSIYGVVCISNHSRFGKFDLDLLSNQCDEFLKVLFSLNNFEESIINKGRFEIKNSLLVGGYICLNVEEIGWTNFCQHVLSQNQISEIYATFYSEYGERTFFAKSNAEDMFSFCFSDDSDEFDQEDFNGSVYWNDVIAKEKKWLSLIDKKLIASFNPLKIYLKDSDFNDGDFNWNALGSHHTFEKLDLLHISINNLLQLLSKKTVESVVEFMTEIIDVSPSDPGLIKEAKRFINKYLDSFLMVLEYCSVNKPDSYFAKDTYGFNAEQAISSEQDRDNLIDVFKLPKFKYNEELDKFLLQTR